MPVRIGDLMAAHPGSGSDITRALVDRDGVRLAYGSTVRTPGGDLLRITGRKGMWVYLADRYREPYVKTVDELRECCHVRCRLHCERPLDIDEDL